MLYFATKYKHKTDMQRIKIALIQKLEFIKLIVNVLSKTLNVLFAGTFFAMVFLPLHAATGTGESGINPCIFIAKNAKICNKEGLYIKQNASQTLAKKSSKTKTKTVEPVKNEIIEKESPENIVVPDFPFDPTPLSYSYTRKESAMPVSQQKINEYPVECKVNRENIYPGFENSSLSLYKPQQRHKLSVAATQCGILTSFIPNSPPL